MSVTLSLGDLQDTKDRDTPIRPSVKLAARWDGRNRSNAGILDFSRAGDKEQDEINRRIDETQRNIKFLMEKSNYYSRNLLAADQANQPTRISTTQPSPKQKPQRSPKKQLNSNSIIKSGSASTFNTGTSSVV